MNTLEKRIVSCLLVLATISTLLGVGSSLWRDYSLAKQGISVEAILEWK